MKKLILLFIAFSNFCFSQDSKDNSLNIKSNENIAYEYFRENILNKQFPKAKRFAFYEKIEAEKIISTKFVIR